MCDSSRVKSRTLRLKLSVSGGRERFPRVITPSMARLLLLCHHYHNECHHKALASSFREACRWLTLLRLGKPISNTTTSAQIFNFDMSAMAWTGRPTTVEFSIEPEPFGTGGFCNAFKATSNDRGFQGSTWVVKRYLDKASKDILAIGQILEKHT